MKFILSICLLLFILFPADSRQQGCAQGDSSQAPLIVMADWLKNNISDPKLVLFHIGPRAEYDAGHIPGALYLSMQDISAPAIPDGLALELPDTDQFKATLENSVSATTRESSFTSARTGCRRPHARITRSTCLASEVIPRCSTAACRHGSPPGMH